MGKERKRKYVEATCRTLVPAGSASTQWRERPQEKQSRDQQTILCGVILSQGGLGYSEAGQAEACAFWLRQASHRGRASCAYFALQDDLSAPSSSTPQQKFAKVITIALSSLQPFIALRRIPLCDPGHHPNNERRHFARYRQTAQDPQNSPLLHHRLPHNSLIHSRLLAKVRAFVLCSFFSSLTDASGLALLLRFRLHESNLGWL
jgi:hypothetical protein